MKLGKLFNRFAKGTAESAGKPGATILATVLVIVWALTGPAFHYSETWQLVINTGTTIVTFLMVFIIQHTQNSDSDALHIKIDELIRVSKASDNKLMDLEHLDVEELGKLRAAYNVLAAKQGSDSGAPACPPKADVEK